MVSQIVFLSTPSGWRATELQTRNYTDKDDFYPRPPGGGRQLATAEAIKKEIISIHALRVEGDGHSNLSIYTTV